LDVYLIHNIAIEQWDAIKKIGALEEWEKFKQEDLIKAIGFSYHGKYPGFKEILDFYDWDMCQIQQNFLDVDREATVQGMLDAGKKGCALVIMEPLRGGGLVNPPPEVKAIYDSYKTKKAPFEWAFRYLADFPQVSTILSGMTTLEQLKANIKLFSEPDMLPGCMSADDKDLLKRVRDKYNSFASVPCTGCEYCLPCPTGVAIPDVFMRYNEASMFKFYDQARRAYYFLKNSNVDASHCVACGACAKKCPQHIKVPDELKKAHALLDGWQE
jgi:predicted aldo/keto reductase-like oxidoreductase